MAKVQPIRPTPPRDGAREALATAIAKREDCRRRCATAAGAISAATDRIIAARRNVEAAEKLEVEAPQRGAESIAEALLAGTELPTDASGDDAQQLRQTAERDLAAARAAKTIVQGSVEELERGLKRAEDAAQRAAVRVFANVDAAALFRGAFALHDQLCGQRAILRFLFDKDLIADPPLKNSVRALLLETSLPGVIGSEVLQGNEQWLRHPTLAAINDALEALTRNPDAALPTALPVVEAGEGSAA